MSHKVLNNVFLKDLGKIDVTSLKTDLLVIPVSTHTKKNNSFKTLDKLNLQPEDCLAIEDTEESSNSAVNAGIKCIGFPGDYHLEDSFQMCIKKMNLLDQSIFSL